MKDVLISHKVYVSMQAGEDFQTNVLQMPVSMTVSLQSRIRAVCSLVDQLWVNLAHSFSASVILCIGLIHKHPSVGKTNRQIIRALVGEGLSTFDFINTFHANTAIRMQRVIDILLAEEEKQFRGSLMETWTQSSGLIDERLLKVVASVVKEVLIDPLPPREAGKFPFATNKNKTQNHPHRPFFGNLRSDFVEPNGVKLGQSQPTLELPEIVCNALAMLKKVASPNDLSTEGDPPSSKEKVNLFEEKGEEADEILNFLSGPVTNNFLPSAKPCSPIDMSDASDSFWGE